MTHSIENGLTCRVPGAIHYELCIPHVAHADPGRPQNTQYLGLRESGPVTNETRENAVGKYQR